MIRLCAIKVAPRKWVITTTEVCWKYEQQRGLVRLTAKEIENWLKDIRGKND